MIRLLRWMILLYLSAPLLGWLIAGAHVGGVAWRQGDL